MSAADKELGEASAARTLSVSEPEAEDDRSSLSSTSTDSASFQEVQYIHQALSRNAGLEENDRSLAPTPSVATHMTSDPQFEVDFDKDDDNPQDWSLVKKGIVTFCMSFSTLVVVMYSTSYTSGIPGIMETFGVKSRTVVVLGVTTYLLGLAFGSILLAPLSEMYGRRPVYVVSLFFYTVLVIPCALAQNLATLLALRFFGAICGSALISNAQGTVADIVSDEYRGIAFSVWSIGPMNGPVIGPLVGGFVFQYLGWRWTNWVVMIGSGISWVMMLGISETYAPALLRAKAAKKRKDTGEDRWFSRYDDKKAFWPFLKENMTRPVLMSLTEPICIFWNIYVALVYAVLYLCFVAYPIIFTDMRGWSPGMTGLSYCGIGIGGLLTIGSEPLLRRMINSHKLDPTTGKPPPEAMVSAVCISAVLVPVGEIIFAWTCTPDVHWIAPIIAGIPFGAGNCGVFIYATSYLIHSYGIYAASALAGNAVLRSILGGTLPLVGTRMYATLGPHWSGTMLALIEFALIPIPLVFYRYGHKIRERSTLIRHMREDQERAENKKNRALERQEKSKSREAVAQGGNKISGL